MKLAFAVALSLVACKQQPSKLDSVKTAPRDAAIAVKKSLDQDLEEVRAKLGLPALASAMWRDGKLLEIGAVGVRKLGEPTPVTTKDQWHLGSNTKAMTATLVGIFVDRGKLKWDDTLATLFPDWKIDPGYAKVTLDQLLHHEAGLPAHPPDDIWAQAWKDGNAPDARTKFAKAMLARPPAQAPGTFTYSNEGYMIAGSALERITGQPWEQLIKTELFDKLDMKSCGFGAPGSKDTLDQPRGHDAGDTPIEPGPAADNPPSVGPAGTVHCSLEDYGKFLNLHALGTPALVTPATLQHLHEPSATGHYAGGWGILPSPNGPLFMHSGTNTMWHVTAMWSPKTKVSFVIATNKMEPKLEGSLGPIILRNKK
jgi:CubicO group peptidase (beta-lactamase class C family)